MVIEPHSLEVSSPPDYSASIVPLIRQRYEQIADHVVEDIRAGRLVPGERLPGERELAQQLGVGRASVREALGFLQVRGLVETRHGAGSFVAPGAADELARSAPVPGLLLPADASPAALLEARAILEPAMARLAGEASARGTTPAPGATRGVAEPIAPATPAARPFGLLADELLERMGAACDARDPAQRRAWSDADRDFHRAIATATGNPVLAAIGAHLAAVMDQPLWQRLRDDSIAVPGHTTLQLAEHRLMAAAIAEGDPEAAEAHTRQHINRARRYMALD